MRVLQVAWEYPPRLFGGLGRHVEGLTGALATAGIDLVVLTPFHGGPEVAPSGVTVLRGTAPASALPPEQWVAEVLDANVAMVERALAEGVQADVLHVHDWMAGHAARVLAASLGTPIVATIHATEVGRHVGHLPPGVSRWIHAQEQALVALADQVVVCADHMADHVVRWLDADPSHVSVVPNGVDVERWSGPAPRGLPGDRVVFAGRLEHEKGIHVLLVATEDLPGDLVIAGTGTFEAELRHRAHPRARFVGHLDQPSLAALLRSAGVVAVPSLYEPFGLAALEAMAAGAPVVASDVGGLRAVVAPGSGLLVPPEDPPALRAAIAAVLAEPGLATRLSAGGAARAESFSWRTAAAMTAAVYTDVVDQGR